jgi:hypothetical protein
MSVSASGAGLVYQWQLNSGSGFSNLSNGGVYSGVTTSTLDITGALVSMNGFSYRCVVSGTCSPSATTNASILTVHSLPVVNSHPSAVTTCSGSNISFSVSAGGTLPTYQWQEFNGTVWSNLSNNSTYLNVFTPTLSIAATPAALNGYQYRCVVGGLCSPAALSNPAALTVNTAPAYSSHPLSTQVCAGSNSGFSVTATGTALTYQWQVSANGGGTWSNLSNTAPYSNVTTASLSITAATAGINGYRYRCVTSGTCAPAAISNGAVLTVNNLPAITGQPANASVCDNGSVSFSVTATGTGISYQWQQNTGSGFTDLVNGGTVTGATGAILSMNFLTTAMSGYQYRCIVSGICSPAAISNNVTLTVNPILVPSVTIAPSVNNICSGTSVTFTATPTNGGTSPVYQWRRNGTNTGTNSPTLTATNFANGEVVTCVITSNAICASPTTATSNAVTMLVTPTVTPTISIATPNNPVCSGSTASFVTVINNGGATPGYQWRKNGNPITGATSATYSDNTLLAGDVISCVLTTSALCASVPTANSNNITMTVQPVVTPSVSITTANTTRCAGQSTTFTATPSNGGTTPIYQWYINFTAVGTNSPIFTTTALADGDVVRCAMISNAPCQSTSGAVTSNTITMTILPLVTPTISIVSNFGTQACLNTPVTFTATISNGGAAPLYQWRRNGLPVGTNSATYTLNTPSTGDIINCVLTSTEACPSPASVTSNSITLTVNPVGLATVGVLASPDTIMCMPSSGITFSANFTNGGTNPQFQWIVNGGDVAGATLGSFFTNSLNNGDTVAVRMTSNATCVFPATSRAVRILQFPRLATGVNITTEDLGPTTRRFTANVVNGGSSPSYQWLRNEKAVPGETNSVYTATGLSNGDRISVEITSNAVCAIPKAFTSNAVTVTTGIQRIANTDVQITTYPNPADAVIHVRTDKTIAGNSEVRILDKLGNVVAVQKVNNLKADEPISVNTGHLAAGTYTIQVVNTEHDFIYNARFTKL